MLSLDMPQTDFAAAIAASPELAGLEPETVEALATAAARVDAPAGTYLFEGALAGDALYLVLEGRLEAVEPRPGGEPDLLRALEPGEAFDELQLLAGVPLPARVRAGTDATLARVPDADVDRLEEAHPDLREALRRVHRRQLLTRLHPLLGALDAALLDALERDAGWVHLGRGQLLFEQGDPAGGVFFVVSGRVALERVDREGCARTVAEVGRGESVGEMAFFVGEPRQTRARALRDSVLVELTQAELEGLVATRPSLLRNVARGLVERLHRAAAGPAAP
ncbi:MAG TPA: cyclic nucleotide-binding domain-containing protein, partial [Longimicrobium sp.]|nr:cyclic nucleotide-binding domain-containing protein [Longimicrobium sp.]